MTVIKYIVKTALKIVLLPVILILRTLMLLAKLAGSVGAYVISPIMLIILGCGIYCLVKTRWTDVAILFGMETAIVALMFCGLWVYATVGDVCDGLDRFLHR